MCRTNRIRSTSISVVSKNRPFCCTFAIENIFPIFRRYDGNLSACSKLRNFGRRNLPKQWGGDKYSGTETAGEERFFPPSNAHEFDRIFASRDASMSHVCRLYQLRGRKRHYLKINRLVWHVTCGFCIAKYNTVSRTMFSLFHSTGDLGNDGRQ